VSFELDALPSRHAASDVLTRRARTGLRHETLQTGEKTLAELDALGVRPVEPVPRAHRC
jgi:hypothetical protein